MVIPWAMLRSESSIATFATALQHAERQLHSGGTAPAGAMALGRALLDKLPWTPMRKVIDISGDGRINTGPQIEEHTSELQSLMRISYAVFCLKKKNTHITYQHNTDKHSITTNRNTRANAT